MPALRYRGSKSRSDATECTNRRPRAGAATPARPVNEPLPAVLRRRRRLPAAPPRRSARSCVHPLRTVASGGSPDHRPCPPSRREDRQVPARRGGRAAAAPAQSGRTCVVGAAGHPEGARPPVPQRADWRRNEEQDLRPQRSHQVSALCGNRSRLAQQAAIERIKVIQQPLEREHPPNVSTRRNPHPVSHLGVPFSTDSLGQGRTAIPIDQQTRFTVSDHGACATDARADRGKASAAASISSPGCPHCLR